MILKKQESKYRWVVFGSVLFVYLLIVSQRTAPGLITDQLMKQFNVSASMIGLLTSVQFFAYAALQIPVGILSDRFGPNLFLIWGALLSGLGTFFYSMATNEWILLLGRLLAGIGDAAIWINLVLILSQWFKVKEFVGLLGIAGMIGSIGSLFASFPFSAWITLSGWRTPFMVMGIILCLSSAFLYIILVKKPKQTLILTSAKNESNQEKTSALLRRIFFDRRAWAAFLCHFSVVGTYVGFIGSWAAPYGMHVYGMTRSSASQLIMVGLIGAFIGSPLSSWLVNRLGSIRRPYMIFHLMICLGWTAFFLFGGKPPVFILFILFLILGFGNGANPLTFAVVRQSFPTHEVGRVSGFANTGGFLSAILLPAIFGKVLDHFQASGSQVGYHYGFIIPVVFSICGLVGGLLIKEQRVEEKKVVVEKVAL